MFKIQLENGEFYKSKSGRIQHYKTIEKTDAKIQKLGEIAAGVKVVECKAKTAVTKEETKEIASDTKVKVIKKKKAVSKPEKPASKTQKTKA